MGELLSFDLPILGHAKESDIPSPEEYTYWKLRENRCFTIDYEIDDDYALLELGKVIIQMNIDEKDIPKEELKPIYIFLHTWGGDIYQGSFFADLLMAVNSN